MLIVTERHTPEDLREWAQLEAADRLRGESATSPLRKRVARSLNELIRFTINKPCYASVSWGKDSVALAHLLWSVNRMVPLVHIRAANDLRAPYRDAVRDDFLARFPLPYREIVADYRRDVPDAENERLFFRLLADCGERHISGIRADESGGRRIRMRKWGLSSPNACAPLGWWTAPDVFAYLATHDLPVHPNYAMLGGGRWPREKLRVDDLGGERGRGVGRGEWEREYYGDILRRLEARAR